VSVPGPDSAGAPAGTVDDARGPAREIRPRSTVPPLSIPWPWRHPRLYDLAFRLSPADRRLRGLEQRRVLAALDAAARPSDHVLEVGAGTGWYTGALAERVRSVRAIEPAPRMRAHLGRRMLRDGRRNVHVADGSLPHDLGGGPPWDGLVCIGVLDYQRDLEECLAAMARAARPGAWMLCTVPARAAAPVDGARRLPIHERVFGRTEREFADAARRAGLRVRDLTPVVLRRRPRTLVASLGVG